MPNYKRYLDEMPGVSLQDLWTDIRPIGSQAAERLGYPTQKPVALLERIIQASSNEGDVVLDPFCGCGTTIAAAQKLNRRWIGIDITQLAIFLIRYRLGDSFGKDCRFEVIGEPTSTQDATALAKETPHQFEWWALGLVGARPAEPKKGADHGIDGRLYSHDEGRGGKTKQIIFSVKAGHVTVSHIRDLVGVITREKAQIGAFLSLEPPTSPCVEKRPQRVSTSLPGASIPASSYSRLKLSWWALGWEHNLSRGHGRTPRIVVEVCDVLDMWSFIEHGYKELLEKDKEQFESELGDVEFTGFYEPDHQSIADFLVDDMGRFRRFKGRDFNSFMPTLIDVHRRMLAIFKSMRRETDLGLGPSTSRVIELLKARINYAA